MQAPRSSKEQPAVLYLGNDGDGQGASLRTFCQDHGYRIEASFANGKSGSATPYPQLLRYLHDHAGVVVVVSSLDVLGTDRNGALVNLFDLDELGAHVHVAGAELIDPTELLLGKGRRREPLADASQKITAGMRKRAIRGEGLGKPPYGYQIGKSRKLEVLDTEAHAVRQIFSLYTQKNLGIRLIVRHLNETGIKTRRGRNWSMVTIRDILRNRTYVGTYTRFGMRVPGSHPAIVSSDMFRWAQTKMEQRKPKRKSPVASPFLLSGLVYCGYCGNRMVGVTRKQSWIRRKDNSRAEKQYRYYQCQSRTNQSVCRYNTRRAPQLEAAVLEFLNERRDRLAALKVKPAALQAQQRERNKLEPLLTVLEKRLRENVSRAATGTLSYPHFRSTTARLLGERRVALDRLAELNGAVGQAATGLTPGQHAARQIEQLSALGSDVPAKHALLQELLEKVTVFDDRNDIALRLG